MHHATRGHVKPARKPALRLGIGDSPMRPTTIASADKSWTRATLRAKRINTDHKTNTINKHQPPTNATDINKHKQPTPSP